jgi:hypothetical protein
MLIPGRRRYWAVCGLVLLAGCATARPPGTAGKALSPADAAVHAMTVAELAAREVPPEDILFIGAGDIAQCGPQLSHAQDTAALIRKFPKAKVFTAGDDAYLNGTTREFNNCYDKSWGSFKRRTFPAPGNHEYGLYLPRPRHTAAPYFNYFGTKAGDPGLGYYSYDLGDWHIVSLNGMAGQPGAPTITAQADWLRQDLDSHKKRCILAYWHHPLFSSGDTHGDDPHDPGRSTDRLWDVLLLHKADVIVNGHDHHYERFGLQDAKHKADKDGIREFVVGTGGGDDRGIKTKKDNSEVRLGHLYGVLLMTLHPSGYEWHFLNVDGTVDDQSTEINSCHDKPGM